MKMTALHTADAANSEPVANFTADKLSGLALVTVLPTLIWTAIITYAAHLFGADLSAPAIAGTAASIVLFLTMIFAALTTGSDQE